MVLDVWMYANPVTWDALAPEGQEWEHVYRYAVRLPSKVVGGKVVYNLLGNKAEIDALAGALGNAESDKWHHGNGLDVLDPVGGYTNPDRILSYMPDHVTYDADGNETGRVPATFDNPNWMHKYSGQKTLVPGEEHRVFAGQFGPDEFSGDFL